MKFFLVSPSSPCGKKFRSKPQIARFLGESADLTCFDFSRAGSPGDGTLRRRARERTTTKKIPTEVVRSVPIVRPLTNNPLRPSGPIRRTCGVIKLPVTWVAPPNDDELRTNLITSNPNDPKQQTPINLIVQSLWEKRLFGVKAYDHMTGSEISATKTQNGLVENDVIKKSPLTPIRKPQSPRTISPSPSQPMFQSSPPPLTSPTLLKPKHSLQLQSLNTPLPALLHTTQNPPQQLQISVTTNRNAVGQGSQQSHLAAKDLLFLLQKQQQPVSHQPQPMAQLSNGPSAPQVPLMVTDSELQLQEERVRLLRQQLLAAECTPQS